MNAWMDGCVLLCLSPNGSRGREEETRRDEARVGHDSVLHPDPGSY